jgi:hypothetical protein
MLLDQLELLEVRLRSGRVYLVPRALLERFVRTCPPSALLLIQEAEVPGAPLDPSGLPQDGLELSPCSLYAGLRRLYKNLVTVHHGVRNLLSVFLL